MRRISRRDFVKAGAALAAGTALGGGKAFAGGMMSGSMMTGGGMGGGGMGGGGMGGGGMGAGVIDPPVGGAYADPKTLPNVSTDPRIAEYAVEAKLATIGVNGTAAQLMTYNGFFPGGVIRARQDQLLRIRFKNSLPADGQTNVLGHSTRVTNLHTHGLHVSPKDNPDEWLFTHGPDEMMSHSDNMLVAVQPGGGEALYEYDLRKHYPGTLNFYHPHIHGSVTDQMWGGMAGPLVVEDPPGLSVTGFETHIMVLKDISLSGGVPVPHTSSMQYMHGLEGDTVLVNGQVNPRLAIRPGQVQRWRIVNASTARFYRLSLSGHSMYLIGTEAGLLDRPYAFTEILLSPGERVDLLIKGTKTSGSYKFLSLPYSRMGMMSSAQITLLTMTYGGKPLSQSLPASVDPTAKRIAMDTSMLPKQRMALSMGMDAGYINGIQFLSHEECYTATSKVGGYEVWEIVNQTNMDHPFHHHVNAAQVLSISGGDAKYASMCTQLPCMKDVTIVPKGGSVRLLMPVMDYGGMAMFHCHIIDHEDIGMMGMWMMDDGMPMPM